MIIKNIYIENFKKIKKADIQLSPKLNIFLGHNASGKTSLIDSIIYTLSDEILGQQKKNFPEMINTDTPMALIVIDFADPNSLRINRTLSKTNRTGPSPEQTAAQLHADADTLRACLSSEYFFGLPSVDQKKFLTNLLGITPTPDFLRKAFSEAGCAENEAQQQLNEDIILTVTNLGWEAGYKEVYSRRRDAKREINVLGENCPELKQSITIGNDEIPIQKAEEMNRDQPFTEQLETFRQKLNKLNRDIGGIAALSDKSKEEIEAKLKAAVTTKNTIENVGRSWEEDDAESLRILKKEKQAFVEKQSKDISALEAIKKEAVEALEKNRHGWKSKLTCPIPKESGKIMCPAIMPDWSAQEKTISQVVDKIQEIQSAVFPQQEEGEELVGKHKAFVADKQKLEEARTLIKTCKEQLAADDPAEKEKKAKTEKEFDRTEGMAARIKEGIAALAERTNLQKIIAGINEKIKTATAVKDHYEALCELLNPEGLQKQLTAEGISKLNDRLLKHKAMIGLEVKFNSQLELVQKDGRGLWVLGGAERSRIQMALAETFAHVSGVRLVLLDEVNISVFEASAHVRKWMMEISSECQIIACAATNAESPPKVKKNEAIKCFWVSDGTFEEL